jgi:hypothetical protein
MMVGMLDSLGTFAYVTPDGKDMGINVRHRCMCGRVEVGTGGMSVCSVCYRLGLGVCGTGTCSSRGAVLHRVQAASTYACVFPASHPPTRPPTHAPPGRARAILALVSDKPRLISEREAAAAKDGRDRYRGFSSHSLPLPNTLKLQAAVQPREQVSPHWAKEGGIDFATPRRNAGETKGVLLAVVQGMRD